MIGKTVKQLMLENQASFMIPAKNVASVMVGNPLEHVLLVLSKVGYSKIPVLGKGDRFVGLISLSCIFNKMLDLDGIHLENIANYQLEDIMEEKPPVVTDDWLLEDVLHLLVDSPFVPVVDKEYVFKGIITRKEVLKAVNHTMHKIEREYEILPKNKEEKTLHIV